MEPTTIKAHAAIRQRANSAKSPSLFDEIFMRIASPPYLVEIGKTQFCGVLRADLSFSSFASLSNSANSFALCSGSLRDRKSTRLNSSHGYISYAVFCLKKKNNLRVCTT